MNNNDVEPKPVNISSPLARFYNELDGKFISYHVYLFNEIVEAEKYFDVLKLLRSVDENTIVIIYINNLGGYFDTGLQLLHAIQDCRGRVCSVIDGQASSMAALLSIAAPYVSVKPYSCLMFHNLSTATEGKGHEVASMIASDQQLFDTVFWEICKGFLTDKEIQQILSGADLYLHSVEIKKRLKKIRKKRTGSIFYD